MTPVEFSRPAGSSTAPNEFETVGRMISGFQPMLAAFLIACAANFGVASAKNTSAPESFIKTIWESMVGSVVR